MHEVWPGHFPQSLYAKRSSNRIGNVPCKLIIVKMREDRIATRGGRDGWRTFHETLLSLGSAPLPALRDAMLGRNVRARCCSG